MNFSFITNIFSYLLLCNILEKESSSTKPFDVRCRKAYKESLFNSLLHLNNTVYINEPYIFKLLIWKPSVSKTW